MSDNRKQHRNLERIIWKEFARCAHGDRDPSSELEQDYFLCWTNTGTNCVESILKEIGEMPSFLMDLDKKSRKEILKNLVKKYVRTYINEQIMSNHEHRRALRAYGTERMED